ncbi:MAG: hypothetical protein H0A75_02810 [Candidatus Methanofishera endochildressiae]|uniref:Uncharacterized protein n=1 Tax=Candidatus Methanofishera endochildressiae TaxID=2738884 RepID=A0A7Z0MNY2_9GAMM|nr:hypothetical protein [Candidatus Methanofishera endochildressiae]
MDVSFLRRRRREEYGRILHEVEEEEYGRILHEVEERSIVVACFLRRRRDKFHVFMSAVKMAFHIVSSAKSHFTLWTC